MLALLGLAVMLAVQAAYLVSLGLRRPIALIPLDTGVVLGGGVAAIGWLATGGPAWAGIAGLAGAALWFASTRHELHLPGGAAPLRVKVGDALPAFRAQTTASVDFTQADLIAAAPALLVLYRGFWCPYCSAQLSELEREYDQLRAAGLAIFALSVDTPDVEAAMEKRLGGRVRLLSDPPGQLLDAVGVRHPDGVPWYDRLLFGAKRQDISKPAVLLVGKDGRIAYLHRARRIDDRPSVAELLAAARAL